MVDAAKPSEPNEPPAVQPGESAALPPMPDEGQEQIAKSLKTPSKPPHIPDELVDPDNVKDQPYRFPGHEGHPFRGDVPDLKKTDRAQPQVGREGHAFVFDLSNAEHLDYYSKIFDMAYNGRVQIGVDRTDFDPKSGKYTAFVRWAFIFTYMKKKVGAMGGIPRG